MRVQPHLPSSPFTATVIDSSGATLCACSAANNPAPPEPRIRMSVSARCRRKLLALHQELGGDGDHDEPESHRVEQSLGIHQQHAADEEHPALVKRGLLE